jgi:hypothetical protein
MSQSFNLPGTYTDYSAAPQVNARLSALFQTGLGSALTGTVNVNSAAFQFAVWNMLYDNDIFVDPGTWFASGGANAISLANSWLATLPSSSSFSLVQLTSRQYQDFVTAGGPLGQVPEPLRFRCSVPARGHDVRDAAPQGPLAIAFERAAAGRPQSGAGGFPGGPRGTQQFCDYQVLGRGFFFGDP